MTGSGRAYVKVARAEAEERTREALLDAADDAFFGDGWEQASLESIAQRAGVTKPTLLRHFGSKDGLLAAAYTRGYEHVRDQRMASPTDSIEGAIDNLLDHYCEFGDRGLKLAALNGGMAREEWGARGRQLHYEWVEHAFGAWLRRAPARRRARLRGALISLCDVQTWAILARDLGMPRAEVRATLILAIRQLLKGD